MPIRMKSLIVGCALGLISGLANAQDLAPLNSDTEKDRIDWSQLEAKFGPVPAAPQGAKFGGVSKTLTNEYWRSLGEGYQSYATKAGVEVVYQAAQNEGDQLGQLSTAENLISQGFNALLFSPQTDNNLQPALEVGGERREFRSSTSMMRLSRVQRTTSATSSATTVFASRNGF